MPEVSGEVLSAAVLEPSKVQVLDIPHARKKLLSALSTSRTDKSPIYGVVIHADDPSSPPNFLVVAKQFIAAYRIAWDAADRSKFVYADRWRGRKGLVEEDAAHGVRFFVGSANVGDVKQELAASPGVYICIGGLDAKFLRSIGLSPWPSTLRQLSHVVQVKESATIGTERIHERARRTRKEITVSHRAAEDARARAADEAIQQESLAWREQFMRNFECWTSKEVAAQATSTAKNRASVTSRWLLKKRIFAIKFGGKRLFPKFEFRSGEPIPVVADVIEEFGTASSGWDLAYFFVTPNPNFGGRRPMDLLTTDPGRVVSLARAFAHAADVF